MADPDWRQRPYLEEGVIPTKGLAVARMAAHITYLSDEALQSKFGRKLQDAAPDLSFDADFQIENYLRYQGTSFVDRFDAILSLCDEGLRLFRSRRRLWRLPCACFKGSKPVLRRVLILTGSIRRKPRARSCCFEAGGARFLCRYRDRSWP